MTAVTFISTFQSKGRVEVPEDVEQFRKGVLGQSLGVSDMKQEMRSCSCSATALAGMGLYSHVFCLLVCLSNAVNPAAPEVLL